VIHARPRRLQPLDTIPQIRLFVKLKLTSCARPGNRVGLFHAGSIHRHARTESEGRAAAQVQRFTAGLRAGRAGQLAACGRSRSRNKEKHMTFQPGQSGNPAGRPKGARGKATILAEELFEGEAEAIIRAAIGMAKAGDAAAVRVCLERVAPRPRGRAIVFELPPLHSAASVLSALADIAAAVSRGDLTPAEADNVSKLLDRYLRTLETAEFERRVAKLEREVGISATKNNQNGHGGHNGHDSQSNRIDQSAQIDPASPYNFGDAP
jgi:hypothetical protein